MTNYQDLKAINREGEREFNLEGPFFSFIFSWIQAFFNHSKNQNKFYDKCTSCEEHDKRVYCDREYRKCTLNIAYSTETSRNYVSNQSK